MAPRPEPVGVLHLITGLGVGGAEMMLLKLLGASDRSRFRSTVVSMTPPGALAPQFAAAGIPVHTLNLRRGIPNPWAVARLVRLLRDLRPTVLQGWMYHADILALLAGRAARVPRVSWNIRCSDLDFPNASRRLRAVFKVHATLSRSSDVAIVNSKAGLDFHSAHGHQPPQWKLIPNGFDSERFRASDSLRAEVRTELGLTATDVAIGMVARFDPFKDHATFFSAARMLLRRVPNVVFVLAGKGLTPANPWVVAQLDGELRPRVRLLGEYSDPARLLTGLDIATLCSLTEGFPNSVGEAMSAELPCIATDVGDCRLLLGDASQLVPPRDPAAVAGAWLGLVLAGADVRRALGAAGRARIRENFSLGSAVDAYESLYTDLALRN